MIGDSPAEYVLVRVAIFFLRLITPACFIYAIITFAAPDYTPLRHHPTWEAILLVYALAECGFFLFVYLPRRASIQEPALHPPLIAPEARRELFLRCLSTTDDVESYIRGWFLGASPSEIKRENLVDWLLWAICSTNREKAREDGTLDMFSIEIDEYVAMVEERMGHKFAPGRNDTLKLMRVSLDPVETVHRPLFFYTLVAIVDAGTHIALMLGGLRHYSAMRWITIFPPRPLTYLSENAVSAEVSYWYRPHTSRTKKPVVFIHGIGIGILPYTGFIREIAAIDPEVGLIVIEVLPISMRILSTERSRSPSSSFCAAIYSILDHHGFDDAVLVGHSYGTILASHLLHHRSSYTSPKRFSSLVLMDPVAFLLHHPDVVYSFVYRVPGPWRANEWMIWFFTSRDLAISALLSRNFFWAEGVLWKDDPVVQNREVVVVLSGQDQILPAPKVWQYLTDGGDVDGLVKMDELEEGDEMWVRGNMKIVYYSKLNHAQLFMARHKRMTVIKEIERLCAAAA